MYSLISALVRTKNNKKWQVVDLTNLSVSLIFSSFREILLLVNVPGVTEPETLNMDQLRLEFTNYSGTISDLFNNIGNRALVTTPGTLDIDIKTVKYADAVRAGYKIHPVTQSGHEDSQLPKEDKTWLKLTKNNFDYQLFQDYCLTAVNGFFHFSETNNEGVYIKDGMKSNLYCHENTCGILSFKDIGKIQTKLITNDMIYQEADKPLYIKTILDIGEDITNKTVLLSIGGYLILPDSKVFSIFNETSLLIDFINYSIPNRFYESRQYLDYTSFELDYPATNAYQVNVDELYSDDFIIKLLTMSQSFIILIDNPDVYFEKHNIRKGRMPGCYTSYLKPNLPLFIGQGMFSNYWYKYQKPFWSLNVIDGFRHYRNYNTTKTKALGGIDDKRIPANPVTWSRAYYLKISKDEFKQP